MLQKAEINPLSSIYMQRVKKVMSDSPGLMDFAIRLVIFVLNLPDGQVLFFGRNSIYRRIVINPVNQKWFWGWLKCLEGWYMLATACPRAGCKNDFLCTLLHCITF